MHSDVRNPNSVEDTACQTVEFHCTFCDLGFRGESALKRHVRRDHQAESKSADWRNAESNSDENLTKNVNSESSKSTTNSYCHICQHEFSSSANLVRHNRRMHSEPEKNDSIKLNKTSLTLFCRLCDSGFDTSDALMDHHVQSHVNTVPEPDVEPNIKRKIPCEKSKPVNEESYCHICQYQVSDI